MDWSELYPAHVRRGESDAVEGKASGGQGDATSALPRPLLKDVEVADIGCGFGGLLMALAPVLPDTLILGKPLRPPHSTATNTN